MNRLDPNPQNRVKTDTLNSNVHCAWRFPHSAMLIKSGFCARHFPFFLPFVVFAFSWKVILFCRCCWFPKRLGADAPNTTLCICNYLLYLQGL